MKSDISKLKAVTFPFELSECHIYLSVAWKKFYITWSQILMRFQKTFAKIISESFNFEKKKYKYSWYVWVWS